MILAVVNCLLSIVVYCSLGHCCVLLVVACWLAFLACCSLFFFLCRFVVVFVCCVSLAVCCLFCGVCYLLYDATVYCLLSVVWWALHGVVRC